MEVKYKTQMDLNLNGSVVETKTFEMSKKYIKILVQVTIFNIICKRMALNENELEKREYEKVPYFVVKRKKQIDDNAIISYLKLIPGFNDAIDQNYLKAIYLFFKNENDEVVENYSLSLKYNTELDSENANKHTPKSVKEATIVLLQAVASLPNSKLKREIYVLKIEVTYNDDTPPDYEPRAFRPCLLPLCINTPTPCLMGNVSTGFHKLTVRCSKTITYPESSSFVKERSLLLEMENEQDENINEEYEISSSVVNDQNPTAAGDKMSSDIFIEPEILETKRSILSTISSGEVKSSSIRTVPDFKCVCELREDFGVDLIECIVCNKKYHAICYGFFKNDKPSNFVCLYCDIHSDKYLNIKKTAILRLIYLFIKSKNEIPRQMLNKLTDDMFLKLKEINFITKDSKNWEECKFDKNFLPNLEQFLFPDQNDSNYFF